MLYNKSLLRIFTELDFFFPQIYSRYIISLLDNNELNVQLIFISFLIFLTIYIVLIM